MLAEIFGVDAIVVVVVVVAVLFGGTQIPKLARSLGSARSEFKKGLDEVQRPVRRHRREHGRVDRRPAETDQALRDDMILLSPPRSS